MDATPIEQARWFLETLFGDVVGPEALIAIWTPKHPATFYDSITTATETEGAAIGAIGLASDRDVYFGCGLYRSGITKGRGKAADVVAITSVWADIDYGPTHKKNVAPDQAAALGILHRLPCQPSIVIESGHGLHAYWLLTEPLSPSAPLSESFPHAMNEGRHAPTHWCSFIQQTAAAMNYAVDSVGDLARVLRVPGTLNHKGEGDPLPVRLLRPDNLTHNPVRYDLSELMDWCSATANPAGGVGVSDPHNTETPPVDPLLNAKAAIAADVIGKLCENDPRFKRTWDQKRSDLADPSPSAYDQALANWAVATGWNDDDIAKLLFTWRRRHGHNLEKLTRPSTATSPGYLRRTIDKARAGREVETAIAEVPSEPPPNQPAADRRAVVLSALRKSLGIPITRWIQDGHEGSDYRLILENGTDILIGPVRHVRSANTFGDAVYEATRLIVRSVKRGIWDKTCCLLGEIAEVQDNPEGGRVGRLAGWLAGYLDDVQLRSPEERAEAAAGGLPFIEDDRLHIQVAGLQQHLRTAVGVRVTNSAVWASLRATGFEQVMIGARAKSGEPWSTRRYWRGPEQWPPVAPAGGYRESFTPNARDKKSSRKRDNAIKPCKTKA